MTKLSLKNGERLDLATRQEKIIEVRELLEQGYISNSKIAQHFGVSVPTANEWRNAALVLIGKDPNGFTREGIRNLQIGRLMAKIERLEAQIKTCDDPKLELQYHDRIRGYYDSLARITGLNTEVQQHYSQSSQLVIIKKAAEDAKPKE